MPLVARKRTLASPRRMKNTFDVAMQTYAYMESTRAFIRVSIRKLEWLFYSCNLKIYSAFQ